MTIWQTGGWSMHTCKGPSLIAIPSKPRDGGPTGEYILLISLSHAKLFDEAAEGAATTVVDPGNNLVQSKETSLLLQKNSLLKITRFDPF